MELGIYRPRQPRTTVLYQLLETHYEQVKAAWEDRFQKTYGFWRGLTDTAVARYLDCGVPEGGFARLRCEDCREEVLLSLTKEQCLFMPTGAGANGKRALLQVKLLAELAPNEIAPRDETGYRLKLVCS